MESTIGYAFLGVAVAAGLLALAAAYGFSRITKSAVESIARQPESKTEIASLATLLGGMLEGAVLFVTIILAASVGILYALG